MSILQKSSQVLNFGKMQRDLFGRADEPTLNAEIAETEPFRRRIGAMIDEFREGVDVEAMSNRVRELPRRFGEELRAKDVPSDQYTQLRGLTRDIRDSLQAAFARQDVHEIRPLIDEVLGHADQMLKPRFTAYWQFFLDDNVNSHYFGGVGPEILGALFITVVGMCINTLAGVPSIVFGLYGHLPVLRHGDHRTQRLRQEHLPAQHQPDERSDPARPHRRPTGSGRPRHLRQADKPRQPPPAGGHGLSEAQSLPQEHFRQRRLWPAPPGRQAQGRTPAHRRAEPAGGGPAG